MNAFNQLYRLQYQPLCYFAERLTGSAEVAQDLVAESFIKLWQRLRDFDSLPAIKSFLYTVVRNAAYDYLKTEKRHQHSHEELRYLSAGNEPDVEKHIIRAEVLRAIFQAIEQLPEKYRDIVKLSLIEGRRTEEIAGLLGIAHQTVRNQKSAGVKLLKLSLFKNGHLSLWGLLSLLIFAG